MNKKGGVLLIIGIVLLVLVILAVGAAIYFYNFYVFKTIRVCVGEGEDAFIPCESTQECRDLLHANNLIEMESVPVFVRETFEDILDESVYCEATCHVKRIRGINQETRELEELDSCEAGEKEFVIEIRGKEGLEIYKFLKEQGSI